MPRKKRRQQLLLPHLSNKKAKTTFAKTVEPGPKPSQKQKQICWSNAFGNVKEATCPGCFKAKLSYTQRRGWEASHINPRAQGGTANSYNLYPLCKDCNGDMADANMFCYFFRDEEYTPPQLKTLIQCMHMVFKIDYPIQYKNFKGQFYQLAKFYYKNIPSSSKVWAHFLRYDIKQNNKRVYEIQQQLDAARELALKANKEYERVYKYSSSTLSIMCLPSVSL